MEEIEQLLERYFASQISGKDCYFDVEELAILINYFLENDDQNNLNSVINIGYKLHPDDVNFTLTIGQTLMAMDDYTSAFKILENITIDGNPDLLMTKIQCFLGLDKYDDAMQIIDKLEADKYPELEYIIEGTASMLNEMDNYYHKALTFINKAMKLFPDNFDIRLEHCFNYELRGETKKAIDLCQKLVDTDPFSADAWYMLGRLNLLCLNLDKALDSLDFAIAAETNDVRHLYEIKSLKAYCLLKNRNYDEAISCYDELLLMEDADILNINPFLAKCYMGLEDYEQAYHLLEPIIEIENLQDEVAITGDLIYCCIETDRSEYAIKLLCKALQKFPHGILEYLATLNLFMDEQSSSILDSPTPEELTRNFLSTNLHYN